jgi:hypothetical protein
VTDKTCATCAHWHQRAGESRGHCNGIPNAREAFSLPYEPLALVDDYGTPTGGLMTMPTFGCVLHEPAALPQGE